MRGRAMCGSWPNLLERLAILYPQQTVGVAELPERYRAGVAPQGAAQELRRLKPGPCEGPCPAGLDLKDIYRRSRSA